MKTINNNISFHLTDLYDGLMDQLNTGQPQVERHVYDIRDLILNIRIFTHNR
jgi:hypothetical protein